MAGHNYVQESLRVAILFDFSSSVLSTARADPPQENVSLPAPSSLSLSLSLSLHRYKNNNGACARAEVAGFGPQMWRDWTAEVQQAGLYDYSPALATEQRLPRVLHADGSAQLADAQPPGSKL